jgi:hypothetical protein
MHMPLHIEGRSCTTSSSGSGEARVDICRYRREVVFAASLPRFAPFPRFAPLPRLGFLQVRTLVTAARPRKCPDRRAREKEACRYVADGRYIDGHG